VNTDTAITLVNGLVYKPGWRMNATDNTARFEGSIVLELVEATYMSERANATQGYAERIDARASFIIQVGALTDDIELYREVLDRIVQFDVHEAREFLRVRETMWAPFHPHRVDGMHRFGRVAEDLTYGLA